jgi:hypothetical protein
MYELKKIGKVFASKFVGTGPSSYEKRIYRAAVWCKEYGCLNYAYCGINRPLFGKLGTRTNL